MKRAWIVGLVLAVIGPSAWLFAGRGRVENVVRIGDAVVELRRAPALSLPPVPGSRAGYDCNSPLFWDDGRLVCFTSHEHPFRAAGSGLKTLAPVPDPVVFEDADSHTGGGRWIEAVHNEPGGPLYMWYHHEPKGIVPGRPDLTAPRIGQMCSFDGGVHWRDQGIIVEADPATFAKRTDNRYFAGGYGDFSVVPDETGDHLYFLLSSYPEAKSGQGIALARIARADLPRPVGNVRMFHEGGWREPGLGGRATSLFPPKGDGWHDRKSEVFWGPSTHWNTALKSYVMLMNRSADPGWGQEGIYVSVNPRIDDPNGWSEPVKLLESKDWYPQVVGSGVGGTDRRAGASARLFVKGRSEWEAKFRRDRPARL